MLGVNLTKKVKDLYSQNQKILGKEIEDDINWEVKMYSWIGKMDTTKIYFGKQSIYFDAISTRIPVSFIHKEKNRICMESQMISNGQSKRAKL